MTIMYTSNRLGEGGLPGPVAKDLYQIILFRVIIENQDYTELFIKHQILISNTGKISENYKIMSDRNITLLDVTFDLEGAMYVLKCNKCKTVYESRQKTFMGLGITRHICHGCNTSLEVGPENFLKDSICHKIPAQHFRPNLFGHF